MRAGPFRIQGVHVAAFAANRADRARTITIVSGVLAVVVLLKVADGLMQGKGVGMLDGAFMLLDIIGIVSGARYFDRARRFHRIAVAAKREPIAVWGVKDKRLYPLDPKAPREELSIVLGPTEHTLVHQLPRAAIGPPPEPQP